MKKLVIGCLFAVCCVSNSSSVSLELPPRLVVSAESNSYTVYMLETYNTKKEQVGSGSCVAYKQVKIEGNYKIYFITANHVISSSADFEKCYIVFNYVNRLNSYYNSNSKKSIECKLESQDSKNDIAIISCNSDVEINIAKISLSPIKPFTKIYSLGFPFGMGLHTTEGVTSFKNEVNGLVSSSSPICPGFSGGGIFNSETGELVGIIISVSVMTSEAAGGMFLKEDYFWNLSYFLPLLAVKDIL